MELENITDAHRVVDPARQMLTKLQTFDSDFKKSHFGLIDMIDETDTTALDNEQPVIDKFHDEVSSYTLRLEALIKCAPAAPRTTAPVVPPPDRRPLTRKMSCIWAGLEQIDKMMKTATTPATSHIDPSLLAQCQEEVLNYKKDLDTLYDELGVTDIRDDYDLFTIHTALERQLSAVAQKIKSLTVLSPTSTSIHLVPLTQESSSQSSTCLHSMETSSIGTILGPVCRSRS